MPRKTVAVIGASNNTHKYGNIAVRAYLAQGYTVYPVNPHETSIEGLEVYRTILDVPEPLDRVTIYVPPEIGVTLLEDMQSKHPEEVWFNPGSESQEIFAKAQTLGLNVVFACSIIDIGEMPSQY